MNLWPQDAGYMRSLELNLVGELGGGGGGVWNVVGGGGGRGDVPLQNPNF